MTTEFQIRVDWLDAPGVRGEALARTWCQLGIHAAGRCVTRVDDLRTRSWRDHVFGSALPLACWLADNALFLTNEARPTEVLESVRNVIHAKRFWHDRHDLVTAREGGTLPELIVSRGRGDVECSWFSQDDASGDRPVRFVTRSDTVRVPRLSFIQEAHRFVMSVLDRCEGIPDPDADYLRVRWPAVASLLHLPPTAPELLAARLGLDPLDVEEVGDGLLAGLTFEGDVGLIEDFWGEVLDRAQPENIPAALAVARDALTTLQAAHGSTGDLRALADARKLASEVWSEPNRPAYAVGWKLARCLRTEILNVGPTAPPGDLAIAIRRLLATTPQGTFTADRRLLDGAADFRADQAPVWIAPKSLHGAPLRFAHARVLAAGILGHGTVALTRSGSVLQRTCRAFAAELLAPAAALQAVIGDEDAIDQGQLDELARQFDVSPRVIEHQLTNHHIASVAA